jgi:accessory gene regulator protein AgrB
MNVFEWIEDISLRIAKKIGEDEEQDSVDLYKYTIFMILSESFSFIGGLIFAILFRCTVPYIILNIVFALLRSGAGGYHCPTFASCFWVSNALFVLFSWLSVTCVDYYMYTFILSAFGGIFIMPVCPKPSDHSPSRGYYEDIRFRKIYRNWLLVFIALSALSIYFGYFLISSTISFSILSVVFIVSHTGERIIRSILRLVYD